jgi:hypothetical protein
LYDASIAARDAIVAGNTGAAVFSLQGVSNLAVEYSDVWGNDGSLVLGGSLPGFGLISGTNANGDSCDTYFNLFADPQFVSPEGGDFHLDSASPCVDAGDPTSPPDPDGSAADMGAFPAALRLFLTAQHSGSQLRLSWNACPGTASYWLYGTINESFFAPGTAPGFDHRLAMLPAAITEWITDEGVGDPGQEWTFVVLAVNDAGWEQARSNHAGERDFVLTISP